MEMTLTEKLETLLLSRKSGKCGTFRQIPRGGMATADGVTVTHHHQNTPRGAAHVIITYGRDGVANDTFTGTPGEPLIEVLLRTPLPKAA